MKVSDRFSLALIFLTLLFYIKESYAQAGRGPVPVLVSEVIEDEFEDRIEALGTLKANESVTLTATVTETVREINFTDGQRVQKGDILAEMTSAEEDALLDEAKAEAKEAELQYERLKPLIERGAVPKSTVDERFRNLQTARARYQAILSRLQDRLIIAPFSGLLGLRNISVGALVVPGTVITTIDDDSVMKLDFSIPSTFISAIKPGLKIIAKARGLEGQEFEGEITSVDSRIDEATRAIIVRALIANPDLVLKPGLLMTVSVYNQPRRTLVVPEEAITSLGRDHFVFRVVQKDGSDIAERVSVKLGSRRAGEVEIITGLAAGDKIIIHGTIHARDQAPVNVLATVKSGDSIQEILKANKEKVE